ncbi:MAG: HEAT repeat domain-containing protein [Planctomycetota bacterium]
MLDLDSGRIPMTNDSPSPHAVTIIRELRKLPPQTIEQEVIPALTDRLMRALDEGLPPQEVLLRGRSLNVINALAAMGPAADPVLEKALGRNPAIDLFLTRKLGAKARSSVPGLLQVPPESDWYWLGYYAAALADPGDDIVPILLANMKTDEKAYAKHIAMLLDAMGPGVVPRVAGALKDGDWYARWSAAKAVELMGPKARAALPVLERVFQDPAEDLDVRVAAARAIARIEGSDPAERYRKIPGLRSELLATTRTKSLAWRRSYMEREGAGGIPEGNHWPITAWAVSAMTTGQNLALANATIRQLLQKGDLGSADANMIWVFVTCHQNASRFPGRLEAATEAALKAFYFKLFDRQRRKPGGNGSTSYLRDVLTESPTLMRFNDDLPLDEYIRDYLALSVMKDDPAYRDIKLGPGDTLEQRYHAFNDFFKEAIKRWALNGLQYQIGSSAYAYKTFPHYFNLIELAPDPVVSHRASMLTDLILMESAQITLSGMRGGSKGRAKRGGLGARWDPYLAMLYGERGSAFFLTMPAASAYQAPEPAVLLHKLGSTEETYEIINDRPTEAGFPKGSNAINYAWRTPEYITGCGMYDPNAPRAAGAMGRWSGVIFRNLAAISLDAYTGEKWNLQHKDVRITQMCSEGPYTPGDTRVAFEALRGKVSEQNGWVFVNNGEAYAAVRVVRGGYFWLDSIRRLLYANDVYSPIIIQTGRARDYISFEKFRSAVLNAPLRVSERKIEYRGPNMERLEFFPMTPDRLKAGARYTLPKVNGQTIDLNPPHAYHSPYMQMKEGHDVVTLTYGDRQWRYDFTHNTVTETPR